MLKKFIIPCSVFIVEIKTSLIELSIKTTRYNRAVAGIFELN